MLQFADGMAHRSLQTAWHIAVCRQHGTSQFASCCNGQCNSGLLVAENCKRHLIRTGGMQHYVYWHTAHVSWHTALRILAYSTRKLAYSTTYTGIQHYAYWHTALRILAYSLRILAYSTTHTGIQLYAYWHTALRILAYRSTHTAMDSTSPDRRLCVVTAPQSL